MKYNYDPLVDALLITLKKGKYKETKEVTPYMNVDINSKGDVLSVEILDAKKHIGSTISKNAKGAPMFEVAPYSKKKVLELLAK